MSKARPGYYAERSGCTSNVDTIARLDEAILKGEAFQKLAKCGTVQASQPEAACWLLNPLQSLGSLPHTPLLSACRMQYGTGLDPSGQVASLQAALPVRLSSTSHKFYRWAARPHRNQFACKSLSEYAVKAVPVADVPADEKILAAFREAHLHLTGLYAEKLAFDGMDYDLVYRAITG
ncbi:hypothetical protein MMC29_003638 [Sticta canariensis]|nr:hypothetical protein [Sticta canariensis]